MSTQTDFIDKIAPGAVKAFKKTGVFASVTIAQAILESGWGKSALARQAKNFFGIKCYGSWDGEVCTMLTREVINGRSTIVKGEFRSYPNLSGSILDHAEFLKENKRYEKAFAAKDGPSFAKAIAKAGYATDPKYADFLVKLITQFKLEKYDNGDLPDIDPEGISKNEQMA